jgi:ferredoxin
MEKREIDKEISYTVRLFNKAEGLDTEIQVFDGEFVLDAADRCAVDLPSSCRNGGCTVCAGRLISGTMEMEDQYVLEEEHIEDGFQLLCCGVLTSDAVIETHQDEVVA